MIKGRNPIQREDDMPVEIIGSGQLKQKLLPVTNHEKDWQSAVLPTGIASIATSARRFTPGRGGL